MFGKKLERQPKNKPIEAKTWNDGIEQVEKLSNVMATPPLDATYTSSGLNLRLVSPPELDARITGGGPGGIYSWQGIVADVENPGEWLDLPIDISGTTTVDPLYERNKNADLPVDTQVLMKRQMGFWMTSYDVCS